MLVAIYVGFTVRYSALGNYLEMQHGLHKAKIDHLFNVLNKCRTKFDCLMYEMLLIEDI